jgi:hypothetical protein
VKNTRINRPAVSAYRPKSPSFEKAEPQLQTREQTRDPVDVYNDMYRSYLEATFNPAAMEAWRLMNMLNPLPLFWSGPNPSTWG